MPVAIKIDTLKFARRLTDAGMDPRQAEAIVEGLSEADTSELAVRPDLARVETKLDTGIAELRADLKAEIAGVKGEIAGVKGEIAALKAEMFQFMYLQAAGIVGLTVALIKLLP